MHACLIHQSIFFLLQVRRRQEAIQSESPQVEINLLNAPRLLQLPLMVHGALAVPEQRHGGLARVGDVDAVNVPVVLDDRLHAGLPKDGLASPPGLHAEQVGVLQLDDEPGPLAEVPPHRVVDDVEGRRAAGLERGRVGLPLQDEALLAIDHLLPDAARLRE